MNGRTSWFAVAAGLAFGALVVFILPGTAQDRLSLGFGWALLTLVFLYGVVILGKMASGEIDLRYLIGEVGGGASMSRFQLLIFTFVIGLSFFFVVAAKKELPNVPGDVLALLGISATTYGVSKSLQSNEFRSKDPLGAKHEMQEHTETDVKVRNS